MTKKLEYLGNPSAVYSILAIWSLSLLTFGIDIPKDVAVPHSHKKHQYVEIDFVVRQDFINKLLNGKIMSPEMLSILVSLLLLDFPYLVLRIVLMVIYGMTTASGLFFALKNALMCLLQGYRFYTLYHTLGKFRNQRRILSISTHFSPENSPEIANIHLEKVQKSTRRKNSNKVKQLP